MVQRKKTSTLRQVPIITKRSDPADVDKAVARFFFGNDIATLAVNSQSFRDLITAMRAAAPLDWSQPEKHRLAGKCLQELTMKLR